MSGVIIDGVQWEHCTNCAKWVRIDNLGYEPPTPEHEYGRDLCIACCNAAPDIEAIIPAQSWLPVFDEVEPEVQPLSALYEKLGIPYEEPDLGPSALGR